MKNSIAVSIFLGVLGISYRADATPAFVLGEDEDAWLHEHCAYYGMVEPPWNTAGAVVEAIGVHLERPIVKTFVCVDRPPFWKNSWVPAERSALECRADDCTAPLLARARAGVPVVIPVSSAQSLGSVVGGGGLGLGDRVQTWRRQGPIR